MSTDSTSPSNGDEAESASPNSDVAPNIIADAAASTVDAGPTSSGEPTTTGEYVVVARRYRPQAFGELIGQQHVAQALCNAIETNRVGHAYLFTGARGVGKTSAARIMAKALNCSKGPTANPCGACDVCESVASGGDVDVLEIDGASNRGIDEIRQLRSNISVRPSRARFKVYIIDEVHMLTKEAFNALLKTLEEPPDHVKFIFCTTDPEKIPITVLSRCQRFDFAPVESNAIVTRLQQIVTAEGATAEPEALMMLARRAAGSMRDSQSLLEQLLSFAGDSITADYVHKMFGTAQTGRIAALADQLQSRNAAAALAEIDAAVHEGVDIGQLAEQLVGHVRDRMAACVGCNGELMLHNAPSDVDELREKGNAWGLQTMLAALQILDQVVARMRQSIHRRVLVEMAIVRIANLSDLQQLSDLIAQTASGSPPPLNVAAPAGVRATPPPATPPATPPPATLSSPARAPAPAPAKKNEITDARPKAATATAPAARVESPASVEPTPETVASAASAISPPSKPSPSLSVPSLNVPSSSVPSSSGPPPSGPSPSGPSPSGPPAPANGSAVAAEKSLAGEDTTSAPQQAAAQQADPQQADPQQTAVATTDGEAQVTVPSADAVMDYETVDPKKLWQAATRTTEGVISEVASDVKSVTRMANKLQITFPTSYGSSFCQRPERHAELEKAVSQLVGRSIRLEFSHDAAPAGKNRDRPPAMSMRDLVRKSSELPIVQKAMELFDAEVTRVQPPAPEKKT